MLEISIPPFELYNPNNNEFTPIKGQTLHLEHSLVSLSKWEAKWHKPFLFAAEYSQEEMLDYVRCMTITQNVNRNVYFGLTSENVDTITKYINDSSTATWFKKDDKKVGKKEIITSEIIYYWMISLNIPMECQRWHLNRLLTLIRVCNEKNAPQKKMSARDVARDNKKLNDARKKALNTRG